MDSDIKVVENVTQILSFFDHDIFTIKEEKSGDYLQREYQIKEIPPSKNYNF